MADEANGMLGIDDLKGQVDTVVVAATDSQGRLFGRRLPAERFSAATRLTACSVNLAWDITQSPPLDAPVAGPHTGWHDVALVPDLATLRRAAWLPRTAISLADIIETRAGAALEVCPRGLLARQVAALAGRGYEALAATEPELYLYRGSYDDLRAADYRGLAPTTLTRGDYTIQHGDAHHELLDRATRALEHSGVPVEAVQGEWGLGQWEVTLRHTDPLAAADRHALLKLALRRLAADAGLAATFMALPEDGAVGSSCHIHLSLISKDGSPAFPDPAREHGMSATMRHAIGGLLRHLDEAMAFYAPTVNSYRRTLREDFAGFGRTWGIDNRTVSCRVVGDTPATLRLELRVPGADANPYLVLAALIASIVSGLDELIDPGPAVIGDAYALELAGDLPRDLLKASERLLTSSWAAAAFGAAATGHYARMARREWNEFAGSVTDWERRRYFELI